MDLEGQPESWEVVTKEFSCCDFIVFFVYSLKVILYEFDLILHYYLSHVMRLWHFLSSVHSFLKNACTAIQWS